MHCSKYLRAPYVALFHAILICSELSAAPWTKFPGIFVAFPGIFGILLTFLRCILQNVQSKSNSLPDNLLSYTLAPGFVQRARTFSSEIFKLCQTFPTRGKFYQALLNSTCSELNVWLKMKSSNCHVGRLVANTLLCIVLFRAHKKSCVIFVF